MPLLVLLSSLIHNVPYTRYGSCTANRNTDFYNFDHVSGSKQFIGKTDFYNFSDGSSTTRNSVGNTDFYTGMTPILSGSMNRIGGTSQVPNEPPVL